MNTVAANHPSAGGTVADRLSAAGTANAMELRGVIRMFEALAAPADIALSIRPGERRSVLGSNGAGRTTCFNCMTGDFPATPGTIRFFGEDITASPPMNVAEAAQGAPARSRCCSPISPCSTTSISLVMVSPRAVFVDQNPDRART